MPKIPKPYKKVTFLSSCCLTCERTDFNYNCYNWFNYNWYNCYNCYNCYNYSRVQLFYIKSIFVKEYKDLRLKE